MEIHFEIDGAVQLNRAFSRYNEQLRDIRGALPQVKEAFYKGERKQFEQGMGRGKWAPLSPEYADWKARHYPGRKILELTGLLKETMFGGTSYLKWYAEPQELAVEVSVPYALFHQRGTRRMPAREVIWLTEETKRDITLAFHRYAVSVLKGGEVGGL